MKDNQKVWIVSAGLIVLGLYFFYKQKKQDSEPVIEEAPKANWDLLLKKGSKGEEVGILQTELKQVKVDKDFGDKTEARLKKVMNVTETSLNDYNKFMNKNKK